MNNIQQVRVQLQKIYESIGPEKVYKNCYCCAQLYNWAISQIS